MSHKLIAREECSEKNTQKKQRKEKVNNNLRYQNKEIGYLMPASKHEKKKYPFQSETSISNNTSAYGAIMDRFLPVMAAVPETKLYDIHGKGTFSYNNTIVITHDNSLSIDTRLNEQFRRHTNDQLSINLNNINNMYTLAGSTINDNNSNTNNTVIADLNNVTPTSRNHHLSFIDVNTKSSQCIDSNLSGHEKSIANALGFKFSRIFTFKPLKNQKKSVNIQENQKDILVNHNSKDKCNKKNNEKKEILDINKTGNKHNNLGYITEVPFKVLDAPGLRNDYYSNLVCWANSSDTIAAGLGSIVYCWNESTGTTPLQQFGTDLISALSYSSNDYLAVGTKNSNILLYKSNSIFVLASISMKINSSICSIKWIPKSNHFFAGNDMGDVALFEILKTETEEVKMFKSGPEKQFPTTKSIKKVNYSIIQKVIFKCDQQQICGMDVNYSGKQLAIGANNNSSSIWDISDLLKPKKLFHLKHEAAVKAVAFCPWMPNLLATGGGSRDKHLRFWHSTSGTLIGKHKTKGQITAVIWSRFKKELLVTFGFCDPGDKNEILIVYSYPSLKPKIKINAPSDMRILTADISNDFGSVCTSISDQSVRIYNVWDSKFDLMSGIYDNGIYGSEIIDTEEGVDKNISTIR